MVFKISLVLMNEIKVWYKKHTKKPLIVRGLNKNIIFDAYFIGVN